MDLQKDLPAWWQDIEKYIGRTRVSAIHLGLEHTHALDEMIQSAQGYFERLDLEGWAGIADPLKGEFRDAIARKGHD